MLRGAFTLALGVWAAGCSPTYWAMPSEDHIPEYAALKAAAASQPQRLTRAPVRPVGGNKVRLALHETGCGRRERVVVLLHGVFSDSRLWRFVRGDLGVDHDLLAIDLPGAGRSDHLDPSDAGTRGYAPEAMARDVLVALRQYLARRPDSPSVTLVGHSLGGTIALWMLADPVLCHQFPDVTGSVDSIVLLAPIDLTARPDFDGSVFDRLASISGLEICLADLSGALREQAAVGARRSVVDPRRATREDADWAAEILRDTPRRRAMQAMLLQADPAAHPPLERIRNGYSELQPPVLIVAGAQDGWFPPAAAQALAAALPDSHARVVPRARHSLPTERPKTVSRIIREFIATRAAATRLPTAAAAASASGSGTTPTTWAFSRDCSAQPTRSGWTGSSSPRTGPRWAGSTPGAPRLLSRPLPAPAPSPRAAARRRGSAPTAASAPAYPRAQRPRAAGSARATRPSTASPPPLPQALDVPDFSPCHSCDRRQRPPKNGKAACLADPERRDIRVMVTVGCPHPSGPRFTPEAGPTEAGRQRLVPIEAPPLPRSEWPRVVKLIARRALPGERGVGDTLARLFDAPKFKGRGAGELFKAYTKKHGIDCGCGQRQDWLNARYPY